MALPIVSSAAGTLTLSLPVPSTPSVVGAELSFQLLDPDWSLSQYSLPLGHSGGLTVEIAP